MNQIRLIRTLDNDQADDLFVVCASFEDRCLGIKIYGDEYRSKEAILIRFTVKRPNSLQDRRRAANFDELFHFLKGKTEVLHVVETDRHNPHALALALEDRVPAWRQSGLRLSIDISCFTRVQLLFVLRHLLATSHSEIRFLYSVPTYYGSLEDKELASDYDRMLVLPFSLGSYGEEGLSPERVLAISMGHEGGRALYAWRFLDPKFTTLIYPGSKHSPDLFAAVVRRNRELIQRLEMGDPAFQALTVDSHDIDAARESFETLLFDIRKQEGSQALYVMPGGPKPISVGLALAARSSTTPIYLAYPVPRRYSTAYSAGLSRILEHRVKAG